MWGKIQLVTVYRTVIVLLVVFLMLRSAWISDDALISLRTALNLSHGWGPGFNATESVQAFTHPLWFLIWLVFGSVTHQWLLSVLLLSVLLCAATIVLLLRSTSSYFRITVLAALLLLSNSFFDFTTSGLENPLAFLAIAALFVITKEIGGADSPPSLWRSALLGLLVAAVALTRLDLLVLVAPTLLLMAWLQRRAVRQLAVATLFALIPLVGWFTWSFVTYASVLPNTFLAKTNSLIPRSELLLNGVRYLWVTFAQDPISLVILLSALLLAGAFGTALLRAWGLGVGLYLLYVVWIGGDFMAGRFLAVPILVSLFILATVQVRDVRRAADPRPPEVSMVLAVSIVVLLGVASQLMGMQITSLTNPQGPRWDLRDWAGVADERGEYVQRGWTMGDLLVLGGSFDRGDSFRTTNILVNSWPQGQGPIGVPTSVIVACGQLGIQGLQAGPQVHIIDECALTDRFLAEQTYTPSYRLGWRPGHLDRDLPSGYVEAVERNDPSLVENPEQEKSLAGLWQRIR